MGGILRNGAALLGILSLAGCVGYGYPGSSYGGYPQAGGPGGYPGGGYYPPGAGAPTYPGNDYGGSVRCESNDGRTRYCAANVRGGVRLTRQLSRTDCIQGRNWGYDNRGIWVAGGCRAEFVTGAGGTYRPGYGNPGYGSYGSGQAIRCESNDGRERYCRVPIRQRADLSKQLSRTRCVQGQNWRWDRGGIWVTGGCRGEFRVY
jgi:hypothetical protein